ncbi:HAMP domain-containing sensor histidine kinase [Maricaulis sp.]|uniref:sensor histidine kinase n=1 Tax=Maricaulis sp. TaxID=1486257 RepID=UPI0026303F95|nr:HAMP domain-containing sensor histidine kinase [Maricaulis sp.]
MSQIELPKLRLFTGMFDDAALEKDYQAATRSQSLKLAAFVASATALIWLVSISHELQIIDAFPAAIYLIAGRVIFAIVGISAAVYWLTRLNRPESAAGTRLLTAWMLLYFLEIAAVSTTYLSLEGTLDGLVDRFLATSFWITLTLGLVGIVNFGFPRHSLLFGLALMAWYGWLLAWFHPPDLRPYLVGGVSMLITLFILFLSVGMLGRAGRRNHFLNLVLKQAREKAERVNSVLSLLLTSTGHDARQPLFALDANAAAMRMALQREDLSLARELAHRQRDLTRTVSHILTSVLELSRAERNLPGWQVREVVPVQELLDHAASQVADLVDLDGIDLRVRPSSLRVQTNPAMIDRILLNLLINAVRHSGASRILLGARKRQGRVCIGVLDNGRGLAEMPVDLSSADFFDHRLSGPQARSGYGLDLAFRMTQLIEASLEIRSRPNAGVAAMVCVQEAPAR